MTTTDINAFAKKVSNGDIFKGKRVHLKSKGLYMTMRGFTSKDKSEAFSYDYDQDKVGEQVFQCDLQGMPVEVELE